MRVFKQPAPRPAWPLTAVLSAFVLLGSLLGIAPLAADEDGEESRRGVRALHLLDCEEGDDCPRTMFLHRSGGFLGVEVTSLSSDLRQHFGAPEDAGVMISKISEDSPADLASLMVGDVITAVDGKAVRTAGHLARLIRSKDEDVPVDIEIMRDQRAQVVRAVIQHRERSTVDLGGLMELEGLEELSNLGPMIGATVAGTLESLDLEALGEGLGEVFEGLEFETLEGMEHLIDEEALEEALGALDETFASDTWQNWAEKLESMDWSLLEERMEELQERMQELELELLQRHRDE